MGTAASSSAPPTVRRTVPANSEKKEPQTPCELRMYGNRHEPVAVIIESIPASKPQASPGTAPFRRNTASVKGSSSATLSAADVVLGATVKDGSPRDAKRARATTPTGSPSSGSATSSIPPPSLAAGARPAALTDAAQATLSFEDVEALTGIHPARVPTTTSLRNQTSSPRPPPPAVPIPAASQPNIASFSAQKPPPTMEVKTPTESILTSSAGSSGRASARLRQSPTPIPHSPRTAVEDPKARDAFGDGASPPVQVRVATSRVVTPVIVSRLSAKNSFLDGDSADHAECTTAYADRQDTIGNSNAVSFSTAVDAADRNYGDRLSNGTATHVAGRGRGGNSRRNYLRANDDERERSTMETLPTAVMQLYAPHLTPFQSPTSTALETDGGAPLGGSIYQMGAVTMSSASLGRLGYGQRTSPAAVAADESDATAAAEQSWFFVQNTPAADNAFEESEGKQGSGREPHSRYPQSGPDVSHSYLLPSVTVNQEGSVHGNSKDDHGETMTRSRPATDRQNSDVSNDGAPRYARGIDARHEASFAKWEPKTRSRQDSSSRSDGAGSLRPGSRRSTQHRSGSESAASFLALAGTEETRYQRALGSVETAAADAEHAYERVHKASTDMLALIESWNQLVEHFEVFAKEVFNLMVTENPSYQDLFLSSTVEQQALTTMGMVGKAVYAYTRTEDMLDLLTEIGARHCLYGVEERHFIAIRDAFLCVYPKYVSPRTYARSIHAWRSCWRILVELLMYGRTSPRAQYYVEMRKRRWILELQAFYEALTERQRARAEDAPRQHLFFVTMVAHAVARDPAMARYERVCEPIPADRAFEAIGRIIANLDDDELVQQYVVQLGFRHFMYDLTPQAMIAFRVSFLSACEHYMHEHELWRCVPTMRRTLAEFWEMVSAKWAVGWTEAVEDQEQADAVVNRSPSPYHSTGGGGGGDGGGFVASTYGPDSYSQADASVNTEPAPAPGELVPAHTPFALAPTAAVSTTTTMPVAMPSPSPTSTADNLLDASASAQSGSTRTDKGFTPSDMAGFLRLTQQTSIDALTATTTSMSHTSASITTTTRHLKGAAAHAPQTGESGCILFTDIEASTNLWEANREVMARAVRRHNIVVRGLVTDYGGYEVKTVGDSFMIATKDAHIALQIALGIQLEMMRSPIATGFSMSAAVPDPQGAGDPACWRDDSLRVRVGIHYCPQLTAAYDSVHRRFDYYGPGVNLAARVEAAACGGQILMTQEAVDALKETGFHSEPHSRYLADFGACSRDPWITLSELTTFTDAGVVTLKGITEPVHLVSVLPSVLAKREFPETLRAKAEH